MIELTETEKAVLASLDEKIGRRISEVQTEIEAKGAEIAALNDRIYVIKRARTDLHAELNRLNALAGKAQVHLPFDEDGDTG